MSIPPSTPPNRNLESSESKVAHAMEETFPPENAHKTKRYRGPTRWVLYVLALIFLVLGIIGAFVPGMPTTVFILMSAWAAARSSPRLHQWLLEHKLFGSILRNWEAGGFVSAKAKRMAVLTMLISVLVMLLVKVPVWATVLASTIMFCVAVWLWLRPEPPTTNSGEAANKP